MKIIKNPKAYNEFDIKGLTAGKIMAIWSVFKSRGVENLSPVEYDVWVVVDRWIEANEPEYHKAVN